MTQAFLDNPELTPLGFADVYMGLSDLGGWQAKSVLPLVDAKVGGKKVNITVVAPNGSGKDQRIIPVAAYWWLFFHPKGRVVITSKSDLQITEQTIPALDAYWDKFGWEKPIRSPRYTLGTPEGGKLIAFVTNDAGRVEGWHERPDSPLLEIVNEAKSVDEPIFGALDRCTPTARLHISSPGLREGRFFKEHESIPGWVRVKAGLKDCPWISPEKIQSVISTYGPDDPMTRSILHGEFMSQADDQFFCLTMEEFDACINAPPQHRPGFRYGFFDFADGRAENVFVTRDGNKFEIKDAWRDKNEDAVVGRAIFLCKQSGLSAGQIAGDAAAKSILDKMAMSGWEINRINFGRPVKETHYKSWSVMAWVEGCNKVKRREVIIPNDPILRTQGCTRRKLFTPDGKLALEDKRIMQEKRGIESPDRWDALMGAMAAQDIAMYNPPRETWDEYSSRVDSVFGSVGY